MANYCLPKFAADTFKSKLKDGTIDPAKLTDMTSEERRSFFTDIVGKENAPDVNALFESKLLLKNQQQGIINWAKQVSGLKPEVQADILSKVNKMTEVLQPKELDSFLNDLANKRLGTEVTAEEASKLVELSKKIEETKGGTDRMEYGRARVAFSDYVADLKNQANKLTLKEYATSPGKVVENTAGLTKSLKASLDNSAIFRQGWKTMFTNPSIWAKNAAQSFADIAKTIGGKEVLKEVRADILSRPTYDLMKKAKLAIGTTEEAFPTTLPEKIPVLGRLYKASENAYTGFIYRMRADVFDKYLEIAKKAGVDVTDKTQLESIGKLVNSLTGRGTLSKFGLSEAGGNTINNLFFSPRFLSSNIDTLTAHQFGKGVTPFVRVQAAKNLVKIIGGTTAILAIANAISPGSVETDPRSSDFGKIKIGNTRFDVSGGMSSIITLLSRLGTLSSKSSTTHKVTPLNSGKYGAQTGMDVLLNFAQGKLAPLPSVGADVIRGQDFNGNKPTIANEASNLLVPLPISNYLQLKNDPNSANDFVGVMADYLGIGANDYTPPKKK